MFKVVNPTHLQFLSNMGVIDNVIPKLEFKVVKQHWDALGVGLINHNEYELSIVIPFFNVYIP